MRQWQEPSSGAELISNDWHLEERKQSSRQIGSHHSKVIEFRCPLLNVNQSPHSVNLLTTLLPTMFSFLSLLLLSLAAEWSASKSCAVNKEEKEVKERRSENRPAKTSSDALSLHSHRTKCRCEKLTDFGRLFFSHSWDLNQSKDSSCELELTYHFWSAFRANKHCYWKLQIHPLSCAPMYLCVYYFKEDTHLSCFF